MFGIRKWGGGLWEPCRELEAVNCLGQEPSGSPTSLRAQGLVQTDGPQAGIALYEVTQGGSSSWSSLLHQQEGA